MKYIIYIKGYFEVEAENKEEAKKNATEKLEMNDWLKVEEAKVADKNTGYFVE